MPKRICLLIMILIMGLTPAAFAQLDVSPPLVIDIDPPAGQERIIPIILTEGENIDSYAFELSYPTDILTFVETDSTGTLTDGWLRSGGQENTLGIVTIGGFNSPGVSGSDTLINVIFMDKGVAGGGNIALTNFADDIENASTTDGTINNTVPVELVSFSAEVADGAITLSWGTATESDNFGFDIEKSLDRERFTRLGFVPGHGTTTQPRQYAFTDNEIDSRQPARFYRLKQIDLDGSFSYSGVLSVTLTTPRAFSLAQNYPNPFNPETTIGYEVPQASQVSIQIYDLKGRLIRTLLEQQMPAGFHSVVWNGRDDFGKDVASGVYVYKMRTGDFTSVRKLTLLR